MPLFTFFLFILNGLNIEGSDRDNLIFGSFGDDGTSGNDQDNVIRGGSGNDTMSGGAGADTFVFFEEGEGIDTILDYDLDYNVGEDRQFIAGGVRLSLTPCTGIACPCPRFIRGNRRCRDEPRTLPRGDHHVDPRCRDIHVGPRTAFR